MLGDCISDNRAVLQQIMSGKPTGGKLQSCQYRCVSQNKTNRLIKQKSVEQRGLCSTDALTLSMFCRVTAVDGHPVDLPLITDCFVQNADTQRDYWSAISPLRATPKCYQNRLLKITVIKDSFFLKNYSTVVLYRPLPSRGQLAKSMSYLTSSYFPNNRIQ